MSDNLGILNLLFLVMFNLSLQSTFNLTELFKTKKCKCSLLISSESLSSLATVIPWYSEVKDSMTPTSSKQVVKKMNATNITVHCEVGLSKTSARVSILGSLKGAPLLLAH